MKGHWWLVPGIVCVVTGVYFLGQGEKPLQFDAGSVASGPSGTGPHSPTKEDWAEAMHGVADDRPPAVNVSTPARATVTDYGAVERTQFLDPDVKYTGITQTDVNGTAVNVGKHLDANDASPELSDAGAGGSQRTPIDIGEYLDPDPMSPGLLSVSPGGASGSERSEIGPHLDPNAVTAEVSSVEPPGQGNVGSRLEVDR